MAIQILILSTLMEVNNYPYKLKKQLSEPIAFDKLGNVTESKLYYHFDSLLKKGLIEVVEIIREEHRPDKQVFSITDKGREALPNKIYQLIESADDISQMVIALANLKYVNREKVVEILQKKIISFKEHYESFKAFDDQLKVNEDKKQLLSFVDQFSSSKVEHTSYWLEELIQKLQQHEF